MSLNIYAFIMIGIHLVLANVVFFSNRLFFIWKLTPKRATLWRMFQWLCYLLLSYFLARMVEYYTVGAIHPQDWEFYATFMLLFMVYSAIGVCYRLYKK